VYIYSRFVVVVVVVVVNAAVVEMAPGANPKTFEFTATTPEL
jgi:hypothetical protein